MLQASHFTFDYDDYPFGRMRLLKTIDRFHDQWPAFKCTVFAIPTEMRRMDWRALESRGEWVHVAPHGFTHAKRECRQPESYMPHVKLLDKLAEDDRWVKLFKPPWYGFDEQFMTMLHERGFAVASKTLYGVPFPAPPDWRFWCIHDSIYATGIRGPDGWHLECHPIYSGTKARLKASKTEISKANIANWVKHWDENSKWAFAEDCVRPMLLKVNVGCELKVWDGWACLDQRDYLHPDIIKWEFPSLLPWGECKADVMLISHLFEYIADDDYTRLLLDAWRVLRPQGVLRLSDTATESGYIWRQPGRSSRGTGTLRSLPTKAKIVAAAERVGFTVHDAAPGVTLSPHKDVLQGDTREMRYRRGQKFYIECVKDIDIPDVSRAKRYDKRMRRTGRYVLPRIGRGLRRLTQDGEKDD